MRKILFWYMPVISFVAVVSPVWAAGGGETAHQGTPFAYILAWLMLILVAVVVGRAYKKSRPTEEHAEAEHKAGLAPVFLMLAVVFLFLTESLSAMVGYHEPSLLGVLRFIIKMGSGVLLMFYGLSFMHGHDEH